LNESTHVTMIIYCTQVKHQSFFFNVPYHIIKMGVTMYEQLINIKNKYFLTFQYF